VNERLLNYRDMVLDKEYRLRIRKPLPDLSVELWDDGLSWMQLSAKIFRRMCELEEAVIFPDERIVFTRTIPGVLPYYCQEIARRLPEGRTLHEMGPISNVCADWGMVLGQGLIQQKAVAQETRKRLAGDQQAIEFLDCAMDSIQAMVDLTRKYVNAAESEGRKDLVKILNRVPAYPARSFHEALQSLRLLHAAVWLGGNYHVGLGRFDQYMWPYLKSDLESGRLNVQEAEALLAEFFISLNKDSDLYPGVQQGDNGQTLTIGGLTPEGLNGCNELTTMVLRVASEVCMIDPKINLRISTLTDLGLLSLASELTRKGLGFPQYSNDDIVIPALEAHGYEPEDARNYTVAACWEFIVPGKGMEVVNIGAVSLPYAVDRAIQDGLQNGQDFQYILERVKKEIKQQVDSLVKPYRDLFLPPAPYYSVLMDGCLESGRDLSFGLKYNNFGIHGAGSSSAADALAAVHQFVFKEKSITFEELITALEDNFNHKEELQRRLMEQAPKIACNNDVADKMLVFLFDSFASACEQIQDNGRGGIIRPGTGSAMYYIWLAEGHDTMREPVVGATADGRKRGEPFSANLSPSLGVLTEGLFSILKSYRKIDYRRIYNGGPITVELSDSVFRDEESIRKVAMFVRTFAQVGCQQLQLNSINAAKLREAKLHPELYRNLIVRVWGWSGYFCELAPEYQDHVIKRALYP
jgi:formate C-acetyltransferase